MTSGLYWGQPLRQHRPLWGQQLSTLYRMWFGGCPVSEIAKVLERSEFSVRRKAAQQNLGTHPNEREAS